MKKIKKQNVIKELQEENKDLKKKVESLDDKIDAMLGFLMLEATQEDYVGYDIKYPFDVFGCREEKVIKQRWIIGLAEEVDITDSKIRKAIRLLKKISYVD